MPKGTSEGSKRTQFKEVSSNVLERFNKSYIPEPMSGCWIWIEGTDNKGYGRITVNKKFILAHRVSYQLFKSNPAGQFVLHTCDNPACVNPEHLYLGDHLDNMKDRSARNRCRYQLGEAGPRAKITEHQVRAIRNDIRSQRIIGLDYGLTQSAIHSIKTKKTWRHI